MRPRGRSGAQSTGQPKDTGSITARVRLASERPTYCHYHSNQTLTEFAEIGVRTYISEPDRGRRNWKGKPAARDAVYANRRRIRAARGKRLLRQRGERLERPFAHLFETGNLRRTHLRGHPNILKRLLIHVCGFNLGLLMRQLTGIGTPRSPQGRTAALVGELIGLLSVYWKHVTRFWGLSSQNPPDSSWGSQATHQSGHTIRELQIIPSATGG